MSRLPSRLSRRRFLESAAAFAVPTVNRFASPSPKLRLLWRYQISEGGSMTLGPAGEGRVVLFQEQSKTALQMTVLNLKTGKPLSQRAAIPPPDGPDQLVPLVVSLPGAGRVLTRHWQAVPQKPTASKQPPLTEKRLDVRDAATGKIVWQVVTHWNSPLVAGEGIVVWQQDNSHQTRPDVTLASDAADGKVRWQLSGDKGTPLAIANGRVYLWTDKINGKYLVTVDSKTGQILGDVRYNPTESSLYQQPSVIFTKDTAVFSEVAAGAGVNEFDILAITLPTGTQRWVADDQEALGLVGSVLVCTPVYRFKPHLLGRDVLTGKILWERKSPTEMYVGVAPDGATFLTRQFEDEPPASRVVQRIRARDGKVVSSFSLPAHQGYAQVSVAGNILLALLQTPGKASSTFVLYAYRLP